MMRIYAVISLLSFAFAVLLGSLLLMRNPRQQLNRLFFLFSMSIAWYSLMEFGLGISSEYEQALYFWKLNAFWPFHTAWWLHFALVFTEHTDWLKKKHRYLFIYGPPIIYFIIDAGFHTIIGPPIPKPWGWTWSVKANPIALSAFLWTISALITSAVLYVRHFRRSENSLERRQNGIMLFAAVIPLLSPILNGAIRWSETELPPLTIGTFILTNTCMAVAIWKHEMLALTPSQAAKSIITTMSDALVITDRDTTIVTANAATCQMLGYSEEALIGQPVKTLFSPKGIFPDYLKQDSRSTEVDICDHGIETAYLTKNGGSVPISLAGSRLFGSNKKMRGYLLIARDISARKKAEDELARYQEQLEELVAERTTQLSTTNVQLQQEINERKRAEKENRILMDQLHQSQKMEGIGRLAGGIAHDFNNLLFVITGYAATVLEQYRDDPDLQTDVTHILEAGKRAGNLTRQLLAFSRKQIVAPVLIDVNDRMTSSSKMFARMIGEHIRINFHPSDIPVKVIMDVTQLDQVLANLLVNARDAMPEGGTITIETATLTVNEINSHEYPQLSKGNYAALHISDTGCGISKENIKKIFEPFFTSKEQGKGTGLGLATVYGIVKQNGGCIHVSSELNTGTKFVIYLPMADSMAVGTREDSIAPRSISGSELILLVEDDQPVRDLAKRQLETEGYRVIEATDAKSAIEIYDNLQKEIDILLTDVIMPGISGVQMVAQITEQFGPPRVLFMSGHNEDMVDVNSAYATNYPLIIKPFSAQQLCNRIREVIDGRISQLPEPSTSFES